MSGKRYPEEFKIHHPQPLRLDKEVRSGFFR